MCYGGQDAIALEAGGWQSNDLWLHEYSPFTDKNIHLVQIATSDDVQEARRIVREEEICGGDPILEGTRIRVSDVVIHVEYHEKTPEEVATSFPAMSVQDVHAALTYYRERPTHVRQEIRNREEHLNRTSTKPVQDHL